MFSKNRGQMSLEDLAVMFGKRTQNSAVKLHNAGELCQMVKIFQRWLSLCLTQATTLI